MTRFSHFIRYNVKTRVSVVSIPVYNLAYTRRTPAQTRSAVIIVVCRKHLGAKAKQASDALLLLMVLVKHCALFIIALRTVNIPATKLC